MSAETMTSMTTTKRRWFQFSLRTLLVVMTVLAVWLGIYVKSFRDRRTAIAAIEDLNGSISYQASGPNWLRKFISDEKCFWNPIAVRFNPKHPITDGDLRTVVTHLLKFDDMNYLNFYKSEITDVGVAQLVPLADQLQSLDIRNTPVSDEGIVYLHRLPKLTLLRLSGSKISAEGLDEIRTSLPNCKFE